MHKSIYAKRWIILEAISVCVNLRISHHFGENLLRHSILHFSTYTMWSLKLAFRWASQSSILVNIGKSTHALFVSMQWLHHYGQNLLTMNRNSSRIIAFDERVCVFIVLFLLLFIYIYIAMTNPEFVCVCVHGSKIAFCTNTEIIEITKYYYAAISIMRLREEGKKQNREYLLKKFTSKCLNVSRWGIKHTFYNAPPVGIFYFKSQFELSSEI